jgi:hypothetical protein
MRALDGDNGLCQHQRKRFNQRPLIHVVNPCAAAEYQGPSFAPAPFQSAHSACGSDFIGTLPYQGGGQASIGSLVVAAVLGGGFWAARGGVAFARRRNLGRVFAAFLALYLVGLVVLWSVSPLLSQ